MQLKRVFVSLLVAVLILSAAVLTVSATEEENFVFAVEFDSTANAEGVLVAKPGETVKVKIAIQKNPGASVISAAVTYDASVMEPVVENGKEKYDLNTELNYASTNSVLPDRVGVVYSEGKVTYLSDASNKEVYTDTGDVVTLYFTVKASNECKTADLKVTGNAISYNAEDDATAVLTTVVENSTCAVSTHGGDFTSKKTEATCEEHGYTELTCSLCNKTYKVIDADPKGHTEVAIPDVEATCKQAGSTGGTKCSVCDKVLVEPTYTTEGSTEGQKCSVCGEIITQPEVIPAKSLAWLWITLAIVVVLGAGGAVAYFLIKKKKAN